MALWPVVSAIPAKSCADFNNPLIILYPNSHHFSFIFKSIPRFKSSSKRYCIKSKISDKPPHTQCFSVLSLDSPWDKGSIWSTLALYMFSLHIPLGIGGLSIAAYVLHQPVLDHQTEAISLLVLQTFELIGALLLLRSNAKSEYKLKSFFKFSKLTEERNWLLSSAIGFGFLVFVVFLTSFIADRFMGTKDVNNPVLKEILLSSDVSKAVCFLVYCLVTPLLEEIIYRGFLLRSLSSTMKWQHAILLSSAVFSAAHFSGENFLQLFIIGCILGYSYSWSGTLSSPIAIHSLYNAMILIITFVS